MITCDTLRAAHLLAAAWRTHCPITELPQDCRPQSWADAYAIQDEMARTLRWPVAGWKVGMASVAAMAEWKIDRPLTGRLFANTLFTSPATIPSELFHTPLVEPEFAVTVDRDFSPQATAYSREEVQQSVREIHLAFEIGDYRISRRPLTALDVLADNGGAGGFVIGPKVENWQSVEFVKVTVLLSIDGRESAVGLGAEWRTDPLDIL